MSLLLSVVAVLSGVAPPAVDRHGDPLPDGAVARLGTARLRHGSFLHSVAFAPDGKTLATGGSDKAVALWDAATGRRLRTLTGQVGRAYKVVFSPDGRLLAAAEDADEVRVWDVATGEARYALPASHQVAPAFSADGGRLAFLDDKKRIHVCDAATGKEVRVLARPNEVTALALSPDGRLVAAGDYGIVRVYVVASGKKVRTHEDRAGTFRVLRWADDGKRLASGSDAGVVCVWEADAEDAVCRFEASEEAGVAGLAFAADGKAVVVLTKDAVVARHDAATGKRLGRSGEPAEEEASLVALSPDGTRFVQADGGAIRVRDAATGKDASALGQLPPIYRAAWSPVDGLVALELSGGGLALWRPAGADEPRRLRDGGFEFLAGFSGDGKLVASEAGEGRVVLWDLATGEPARTIETGEDGAGPLAFASDGRSFAVQAGEAVVVVDPATGKARLTLRDVVAVRRCAGFSPDGRTLVVVEKGGREARLWEAATGRPRGRIRLDHKPVGIAFAPDGSALAAVDDVGNVVVYDLATGAQRRRISGADDRALAVAWSPDGKVLATGTTAGAVRLWDAATGREVRHLAGHVGTVDAVAFSPDGKFLVSGGGDSTALVWDVAAVLAARPAVGADVPRPVADLWADLATDGPRAFAAVNALAARPDEAVALLKERLRPAVAPAAATVAKLVADLDSDAFEVRDAARKGLAALDLLAAPALRAALTNKPSPETKRVLEELLAAVDAPPAEPDRLRELLAVEALERAATPDARRVLDALAAGAKDARLTDEASRAVERLTRRAALPR